MQTWKISFDRIQRQHQRAAQILSLMAVLDRQGIPKLLLRNDNERESDFTEAIGVLKAYSLIIIEIEGGLFVLHRLVQVFTQSWLELQKKREDFEGAALRVLSVKFQFREYEDWELCEILLPHAQKVLICRFLPDPNLLHLAALLCNVGRYENEQGRYNVAYENSKKGYTELKKLLGEEHSDTLTSMNNLAIVLYSQAKYKDAEKLHRKTLAIRQKVLGKEHPSTLSSMNNLALVLGSQGNYQDAEDLD